MNCCHVNRRLGPSGPDLLLQLQGHRPQLTGPQATNYKSSVAMVKSSPLKSTYNLWKWKYISKRGFFQNLCVNRGLLKTLVMRMQSSAQVIVTEKVPSFPASELEIPRPNIVSNAFMVNLI